MWCVCLWTYSICRACSAYDQFLDRDWLLTNKLLLQGFQQSCLEAAFCKCYGPYNYLGCQYGMSLSKYGFIAIFKPFFIHIFWLRIASFTWSKQYGFTVGVTSRQGIFTPPRHPIPPLVYPGVRVFPTLVLHSIWDLRDWSLFVIFSRSSAAGWRFRFCYPRALRIWLLLTNEMVKVMNSNQSQEYTIKSTANTDPWKYQGQIMCLRGVSILCQPVTMTSVLYLDQEHGVTGSQNQFVKNAFTMVWNTSDTSRQNDKMFWQWLWNLLNADPKQKFWNSVRSTYRDICLPWYKTDHTQNKILRIVISWET